ncbi:MAG: hypothetical protein GX963_11970 [Bacteroidales bacterium]|nr:hypothetical protein [Bacteroidales bacterium]
MKRFLLGAVLGAAAGYYVRKLQEEDYFEKLEDRFDDFLAKSKKRLKNIKDVTQNEAEYIKDRIDNVIEKAQED